MSQFPVIGKPLIVFNEEQIGKVEELAAVLTKTQIADYMGVCANTFRAIEERQPEVARAFRAGKSRAIADVATNLIAQALVLRILWISMSFRLSDRFHELVLRDLLTTSKSSDATRASNNRYISKSKKQAVHVNQIDN